MIGRELHLSRQVEEDIVMLQGCEARLEPVDIVLQVLHAVQHRAIRSYIQLGHDIRDGNEVREGDVTGVGDAFVGRIQIDDMDAAFQGREELGQCVPAYLVHAIAVRRLSRTGRSDLGVVSAYTTRTIS